MMELAFWAIQTQMYLPMLLVTLYSVQLRSVISESIFPIQTMPIKMPTVWFFYLKCVIYLRRTVILSEI